MSAIENFSYSVDFLSKPVDKKQMEDFINLTLVKIQKYIEENFPIVEKAIEYRNAVILFKSSILPHMDQAENLNLDSMDTRDLTVLLNNTVFEGDLDRLPIISYIDTAEFVEMRSKKEVVLKAIEVVVAKSLAGLAELNLLPKNP